MCNVKNALLSKELPSGPPALELPRDLWVDIFLNVIKDCNLEEAKKSYRYGSLTCKNFKDLMKDKRIVATLLDKSYLPPLPFLRSLIQAEKIAFSVLKRHYECHLSASLGKGLKQSISLLKSLDEKERDHFTHLSLSHLLPPLGGRENGKEWSSLLKNFFGLLPNLNTVRFPLKTDTIKPLLEVLSAKKITGIEVTSFEAGIPLRLAYEHFADLRSVTLTDCPKITNTDLKPLAKTKIQSLSLFHTPLIVLEELQIPSLKKLHLRGDNFTDETARFILRKFPDLEDLCVASTAISRQTIKVIVTCLNKLKELDLSHLPVRDEDLVSISSNHSLVTLKLYGCKEMTAQGLAKVIERCPKLTTLDIRYCIGTENLVFLLPYLYERRITILN